MRSKSRTNNCARCSEHARHSDEKLRQLLASLLAKGDTALALRGNEDNSRVMDRFKALGYME